MTSWNVHELGIFSVKDFIFGIDASQIKEIVTTKDLEFVIKPDDTSPFIVIWYNNNPLPVFNLMKQFHISGHPHAYVTPSPFMFVTFHRAELLIACSIDSVEGFTNVSFGSLKPVPEILIKAARTICVWGFYDMSGTLVPLIDFEQVVTDQDVALYKEVQHSF
jgi:chemotaxis signal transduction protein